MKVIGLDLSYTRTGIVLLESKSEGMTESITLLDSLAMKFPPTEKRLSKAYGALSSELAPGRHPAFLTVDLAVIEDPIYGVFSKFSKIIPTASLKLAELAAVFKIFLEIRNLPYLTVSPTSVKRFITGRGDAEKALVASEIKRRYAISFAKDPGNDLSDAAALALWGLLTKGSSHD
jgi:Holliday junction resolvasome RuvABC endonuclease subunit